MLDIKYSKHNELGNLRLLNDYLTNNCTQSTATTHTHFVLN